jgi:hypothetical protein
MCLPHVSSIEKTVLKKLTALFAKFFPGNFKTIHFMELFRVMILKMIFVFEGRKSCKPLDSATFHPSLNTYLESIYFSTLSLLHLYCG